MTLHDGIRGAMKPSGQEKATDDFLADCIACCLAMDPSMAQTKPGSLTQAAVSVAVQRILEWSSRKAGEDDPDLWPSQALIGVFTGLGLSIVQLGYDEAEVLFRGVRATLKAATEARAMSEPN